MAVNTLWTCDRCGETDKRPSGDGGRPTLWGRVTHANGTHVDLCSCCRQSFYTFVDNTHPVQPRS